MKINLGAVKAAQQQAGGSGGRGGSVAGKDGSKVVLVEFKNNEKLDTLIYTPTSTPPFSFNVCFCFITRAHQLYRPSIEPLLFICLDVTPLVLNHRSSC